MAVVGDDGPVALGGLRQRAALAVLVLSANQVVSIDRLVDAVWPTEPPSTATTTLQAYLSRLRRVTAPLGLQIVTRRPGYVLEVDDDRIDARRFERLVSAGRQSVAGGDLEGGSARLRDALALWTGPALADFVYEPFAAAEIARLEELRLTVLEERIDGDLALGRVSQVVPELEALVAEHPLREGFRGQLMRALHWTGRRAEALRVYQAGRDRLGEELGIDPGTELQRLETSILLQDDEIERAKPAPTAGGRGTLPMAITSFVGRERERDELTRLVTEHRVVTIVGPGGAGKTRLAIETAAALADSIPGGAHFIDLASVRDPEQVARAVAQTMAIPDDADRPPRDAVIASLAHRSCLLVLDNCEQVNSAVASFVAELVRAGAGAQVLATSRQPLELAGEVAWAIPPLAVPPAELTSLADAAAFDAVRLLIDRAATAAPNLELGDADVAALVSIARRLDGMPLGLELAAGRLRGLSPAEVDVRLDDRFRLLAAGSSGNVERHRTLAAAVEWSYEMLSDAERVLFDRLSVFAGTFTLDVVEAVCAGDGVDEVDVVDLLTGLVGKSLVSRVDTAGGTSRYRLLETLRSYGAVRLAARGEADDIRARHARSCRTRAAEAGPALRTSGWEAALARYEAERDDYHAALAWLIDERRGGEAVALAAVVWPFWYRAAHLDGVRWLAAALALPGATDADRCAALLGGAALAILADDLDHGLPWVEEALALAERLDDRPALAHARLVRGEMRRLQNDHEAADEDARTAADLAGACSASWVRADALRVRLLVAWDRGDSATAERYGHEALRLWRAGGDMSRAAGARALLGQFAAERGRFDEAAELYGESLAGFERTGDADGVAHDLLCLARLALDRGKPGEAGDLAAEAARRREELGDRRNQGQAWTVRAQAAWQDRKLDDAEQHVRRAIELLESVGFGGDLAIAFQTAAWVALRQGRLEAAQRWYERWREQVESVGAHRQAVRGLCLTARLSTEAGDTVAAREAAEQARALAGDINDDRGRAIALETLAAVAIAEGNQVEAEILARAANTARLEAAVVMTPDEQAERASLLSHLDVVIDLTEAGVFDDQTQVT